MRFEELLHCVLAVIVDYIYFGGVQDKTGNTGEENRKGEEFVSSDGGNRISLVTFG